MIKTLLPKLFTLQPSAEFCISQPFKTFCFSCTTFSGTRLIDVGYICNGSVTCQGIEPCNVGCLEYYKCQNGSCVLRSTLFDGDSCNGCSEDDGWKTGIGFKCVRNGEYCRIPQQLLWDQICDCDQGEDLCYDNHNLSINEIMLSRLMHCDVTMKLKGVVVICHFIKVIMM